MLKKLLRFQKFDINEFLGHSQLLLTKIEEWREGEDPEHVRVVGTKITGVIAVDGADYGNGLKNVNRGESITIKVQQPVSAFESWDPFVTVFKITKATKATVYGDYRNQLSITVPSLEEVRQ